MGRPIKAVNVKNLHLTLRFLGQTHPDQIRPVSMVIRRVAGQMFDFDLVGLGAFPNGRRPRAVWAGVSNAEPAATMVEALRSPLAQLGWLSQGRRWHAHVTLARVNGKPTAGLFDLLSRYRHTPFGRVTAKSVILMQSQLGQRDAVYVPLDTVALT